MCIRDRSITLDFSCSGRDENNVVLDGSLKEINKTIPGKVYPYLNYEDWLEKVKQAK